MNVKNLTGYRPPTCGCKSYKEHWEKSTNSTFNKCARKGCGNYADVGGHVINCHGNASAVWYIVPLCNSCNSIPTDECYELNSWVVPVRVTDKSTC
ncbi:MAG: hypothetical protein HRT71_19680 [Flavobacteriales bacterium]|nr:hypothetical protein [Flavobacteriales bacterium]